MSKDLVEVAAVSGQATTENESAQIADAVINLMRMYGSLKARLANSADPDVAPLFLLFRLVKEGPRRAKDLADSMCADQSTVSRQVAGLVKAGLIERQADPDDGRASILVPTKAGADKVHAHFANRGQTFEPIIADWSRADRSDFLRLLQQYTAGLEDHRDEVVAIMSNGYQASLPANSILPHARTERSN